MKDQVLVVVLCGLAALAAVGWWMNHAVRTQREQALAEREAAAEALAPKNAPAAEHLVAARDDKGAWGTVKGKVVLADGGEVPEPKEIAVDKDQEHCLGKGKLFSEELVVNKKNRGVQYAFAWLAPEEGGEPLKKTVHPSLKEIKDKEVTFDQPRCQFVPHARGIREGQVVVAKNSSPIAHNVHWIGWPTTNPGNNVIVPAKGEIKIEDLVADKRPVQLKCDIHAWMSGWIRIFDHPYFAVTDANGSFEIKLAPAGKYRLVVARDNGQYVTPKEGIPIEIKADGKTDAGNIEMKLPDEK